MRLKNIIINVYEQNRRQTNWMLNLNDFVV